jgi:hypothetical protein
MTFHTFYSKTYSGGFYLDYDSEATWEEIVDSVLHDPVKAKLECPAIILNRFKEVEDRRGNITIKNRYENLDHTTGWYGLDVDNTGNLTQLVKKILFSKLSELKLVWISSSNNGVKAIGYNNKLKNLTPEKFKSSYRILCLDLRYRARMRINFDQAMGRCHQPLFINSDSKALVRK